MHSRFALGSLAAAMVACSDATAPTPDQINGSWTEPFAIAGEAFLMQLSDTAGVVSGSGSWAGEAAPFGTLEISGASLGDSLSLGVVYVPNAIFPQLAPDNARFEGRLVTSDEIDGTIVHADGRTERIRLNRLNPIQDLP